MTLDAIINNLVTYNEKNGQAILCQEELDAIIEFLIDYEALSTEIVRIRKKEIEANAEAVNHPAHYQGKRECIEVMRALFGDAAVMGFCKCNSFKYRFRQDGKGGAQDVEKAEWYEDYLIQMQNEHDEKADKIWDHT